MLMRRSSPRAKLNRGFVCCGACATFLGMLFAPPVLRAKVASPKVVPVFVNGTDGYTCFRIPAIVKTPDGTLLAFAEARLKSCADFGNVRIVMRTSRNQGRTWSALRTVADNDNLQAGNPAPAVDTQDARYPKGRVFLIYCTGNAPERDVLRGKGVRRVWYKTSADDGKTWSPPVEITTSVKLPSWRAYGTGPGHALQIVGGRYSGRIVIPAYHSQTMPGSLAQNYVAHTFFSDNHGRSWTLGANVPIPGSNESTAAQIQSGGIVMNSRDQSGTHLRILSFSNDGTRSWIKSSVAHDLIGPTCEGSMISVPVSGKGSVLLFSNPANTSLRWDLTVSASTDGGKTWPRHTLLYSGPSAYSDIALLQHHRLGILFERGNEGGIVFFTWPISSLM